VSDVVPVVEGKGGAEALARLVRTSSFPAFLIRLPDSQVLEVSDRMVEVADRSRAEMMKIRMIDYVREPEVVRQSLDLLTEGKIDGYTRRGALLQPDGEYQPLVLRISAATDECPRALAVGLVLDLPLSTDVTSLGSPASLPPTSVLGTVDGQLRIDRITSDVEDLLGYRPDELLGQSAFMAVHPEDVAGTLLLAAHAAASSGGAAGRIRLRHPSGEWLSCRVAVMALGGQSPGAFAFSLSPLEDEVELDSPRVRELEDHLRRIAREVTASGVAAMGSTVPTALEVPALARLTSREYEIVVRLVSGQRVPSIARHLFLSESTIRNHLTSAYRKLGVGSQLELLEKLKLPET
jgi:DNA-binding CsgD family transcriptional regulator/PAS domain-containing protein